MSDEKLWSLFSSLMENYSETIERLRKDAGLTAAEFKGLLCLDVDEEISCQDLSRRMNLSVSRGSRVIESLFSTGLLERADSSTDRRCKQVWLTKKGGEIRKRLDSQFQKCEEKLTSGMSAHRVKNLKSELKDLHKRF